MYRGVARGLKYTASSNFSFQSKWLSSYSPLSVMPVTLRQRRDEDLSSAPPISSHAEYLVQLGKTSQLVRQSFSHLDWIVRDVGFERSQQAKVYLFHASRDVFIAKQKILRSAGHLINYMSENLSQLNAKEKAFAFRLLAILNPVYASLKQHQNAQLTNVLQQFERDYYQLDLSQLEITDLINYMAAFIFYRYLPGANAHHLHAHSTSTAYELLIAGIKKEPVANAWNGEARNRRKTNVNQTSTEQDIQLNSALNGSERLKSMDELNRNWSLDERLRLINSLQLVNQLPLIDRNGKSVFFHVLIKEHYDRLIEPLDQSVERREHHLLTIGTVLSMFRRNSSNLMLGAETRQQYMDLFGQQAFTLIENLSSSVFPQDITRVTLIDWFTQLKFSENTRGVRCGAEAASANAQLHQYKLSLRSLYDNELRTSVSKMNVRRLHITLILLTKLDKSLKLSKDKNKSFEQDFIYLYQPVYAKLLDDNEKPTNEPWLGDEENYSLNKGQVKNCLNACPDLGSPISALRLAAYIFDLTQVSFLVNSIVTSLNNECQFLTGAMDSSSDRDYHLNVILNLWRSKLRSSGDLFNSTRILLFKSLYQRFVQDSPAAISQKDLDNKAKALSLLLNNRELAFSLFPSIELHLRNWLSSKEPSSFSLSFNSLDKIIDPIVKNVKEYVNEYPTQTQNILQDTYSYLIRRLTTNMAKHAHGSDLSGGSALFKNLFKLNSSLFNSSSISLDEFKADFNQLLSEFERSTEKASEDLNAFKYKVKAFERSLYIYTIHLKYIANLALLSDFYNKNLLMDVVSLSVRIASILSENLFLRVMSENNHSPEDYSFDKKSVLELITLFGLFNYFDRTHLERSDRERSDKFKKSLKALEQVNKKLYAHFNEEFKKTHTIDLIKYGLNAVNLGFEFEPFVSEVANQIRQVLKSSEAAQLRDVQKVNLTKKVICSMYQTMCIKNNNFDWIFIDYKPNLRNLNSLSQVGDILTSLTSRDYVLQNPQYKYTFRADFEMAIDQKNNFVSLNAKNIKHRIPIFVIDNSYFCSNLNAFKKPLAQYIENFEMLHPLVTLNADTLLRMKTRNECMEYVNQRLILGLKNHARNKKSE